MHCEVERATLTMPFSFVMYKSEVTLLETSSLFRITPLFEFALSSPTISSISFFAIPFAFAALLTASTSSLSRMMINVALAVR